MLRTITIVAAAGVCSPALASQFSRIAPVSAEEVRLTHVYHNVATGERIISRQIGARSGGPELVWESAGATPCPNLTGAIVVDDPSDADSFGRIFMDWGDIQPGTVVSMVQFSIATDYPDADVDGDGFADGVPGLGVRLAFFSGENGGGSSVEVGAVTLMDLPGQMTPFVIESYLFSVDLSGVGTPEGIPLGSVDVDGDGLADFGYSIEYLHPSLDNLPPQKTYLFLGAPAGHALPDGQGGWTIVPDPAPNAQGTTDAIDVYKRDVFGEPQFVETINGQFSCDPSAGGFYAQIAMSLFGVPAETCDADLNGDSVLNFFDLAQYIQWFNAADPRADVFPAGGDGVFNFFDVSAYLAFFNAGCP